MSKRSLLLASNFLTTSTCGGHSIGAAIDVVKLVRKGTKRLFVNNSIMLDLNKNNASSDNTADNDMDRLCRSTPLNSIIRLWHQV